MSRSVLFFLLIMIISSCRDSQQNKLLHLPANVESYSTVIVSHEDLVFRDLNKNDSLDIYEDPRNKIEDRIEDLMSQMTTDQKAGLLFINGAPVSTTADPASKKGARFPSSMMPTIASSMKEKSMTHFNIWDIPEDVRIMADWYNKVQQLAESLPLGIPVTIASDPRHHFDQNIFAESAITFSQFCEPLGFGALQDEKLVSDFASIVRQEYLAVGIREALHPQIDLATEPRWPRIVATFGSDAELTSRLGRSYILGLQGTKLDSTSIATMTKHFPGGGPQKNGLDPHFSFQEGQIYPGQNFDYHLIPFQEAIKVGTAAIMPYYGIPIAQTEQDVAMAFNKEIIMGILRKKMGYDGVVCTDWGLITDTPVGNGHVWKARAWGVENLSEADRVLKAIDAGCDQFGGENRPELVLQLLEEGRLSEARLDTSVRRILKVKFELGLFDNPFVDPTMVDSIVGTEENVKLGELSQRESMTLLKNEGELLPLALNDTLLVYAENMDTTVLSRYCHVVKSPEEADLAIIRLKTPWYPVESPVPFAASFHHGDLDYKNSEKAHILDLLRTVPTIVDIYLDRPAVIPQISQASAGLIANYGASDSALCDVLFGIVKPKGKLPIELPSSMDAVYQQKPDLPYDSADPLYPFGFGLAYK